MKAQYILAKFAACTFLFGLHFIINLLRLSQDSLTNNNPAMSTRFNRWCNSLTPLKQVAVAFIFNWFLWFIGSLLGDSVFYDEKHSLTYHVFNATWMAAFMTVPFNWKGVKALFKHNNNPTIRTDN